MKGLIIALLFLTSNFSVAFSLDSPEDSATDDWLTTARITTPLGFGTTWEAGVARAIHNNANVLLDWAGFSDSYRGTILDTNESLAELEEKVAYVHAEYPMVKYMVYIAPLEMITYNSDMNEDGFDDDGAASTYTDHPEWLQMGVDGRKAVFYGSMDGMPFWVAPTSEDVWISPSNPGYHKFIMDLARRIALTGVDAVWFDVPHLCFNFGDGWQNQWCSLDLATRNDFYNHTGLQLPNPPFQPNWRDPIWQQFVLWRYKQILDFVDDFNKALKSGNPSCKLIMETSSNSVLITQHGCDLIELPEFCDAIAHEYTGPYVEWQYYSWLQMLATLKFWHDLDVNPSWLLSYVLHGNVDLARYHAALVTAMQYNYYTSGDIGMAGIVDEVFMQEFFSWLENHDDNYYGWDTGWDDASTVALVYSQQTLDFLDRGQWSGYAYHDEFLGVMMMLIESNIPFQVLADRELERCHEYDTIILDDVACMSNKQASALREFVTQGGTVIVINETSLYNEFGERREDFALSDVLGVSIIDVDNTLIYTNKFGNGSCVFTLFPLGRYYIWKATPWAQYGDRIAAEQWREQFLKFINLGNLTFPFIIEGQAVAIPYEKQGIKALRILNLANIHRGNAVPQVQEIKITLPLELSNVTVFDFMEGYSTAEVQSDEGISVITIDIHTQSVLLIEEHQKVLYADILHPRGGNVYFMGRELMHVPTDDAIVLGPLPIAASTNGHMVEFFVDDVLTFTDHESPFEWTWDEPALLGHTIRVIAFDRRDNMAIAEQDIWIFNL